MLIAFLNLLQVIGFSKVDYFNAIASDDIGIISSIIVKIDRSTDDSDKMAYLGALYMKKAGLIKPIKTKLELFKSGKSLLENAIAQKKNNPEYRLLRLIIQEHAPGILKYNDKIAEDTEIILSSIDVFPSDVKNAFFNYVKNSPALKRKKIPVQ